MLVMFIFILIIEVSVVWFQFSLVITKDDTNIYKIAHISIISI